MTIHNLQATGSYDEEKDEYSLALATDRTLFAFDFLKKEDLEHIKSCIECMLISDLEAEHNA